MFLNVFSIFTFSSCSIIVLSVSCVLCIVLFLWCILFCLCFMASSNSFRAIFLSLLAVFTSFEFFFFIDVFNTFFPIVFVRACFMAISSSSYVVIFVCVLFLYVFVVQLPFFFCSFFPYGIFSCFYLYCCVPYQLTFWLGVSITSCFCFSVWMCVPIILNCLSISLLFSFSCGP